MRLLVTLGHLSDHQRVSIAIIAGAAVMLGLPGSILTDTRLIAGWDAGAGVSLLLAWLTMSDADAQATKRSTHDKRQSSTAILWLVTLAALASVLTLIFLFKTETNADPLEKSIHIGLSVLALMTSWLLIHTRFAFHYAHRYYVSGGPHHIKEIGGLDFPGDNEPDYLDFAYFSFVIGMTSQVSDVAVTSRTMRRLTLMHSLLAFAFNMAVLALSINIVASII
ncbi:MAG: DUF1345 domain-containing protein [Sulfuriferula sp.]|nr:DUF1345 domain-containing protein [Sulfuriferula sp.]